MGYNLPPPPQPKKKTVIRVTRSGGTKTSSGQRAPAKAPVRNKAKQTKPNPYGLKKVYKAPAKKKATANPRAPAKVTTADFPIDVTPPMPEQYINQYGFPVYTPGSPALRSVSKPLAYLQGGAAGTATGNVYPQTVVSGSALPGSTFRQSPADASAGPLPDARVAPNTGTNAVRQRPITGSTLQGTRLNEIYPGADPWAGSAPAGTRSAGPGAKASATGSQTGKSGGKGGYRGGSGGYRRRSYGGRSSYRRSYSRRSYSGGGGSSGGGGGGGTANADEYGKFGIPKEYMEAYKLFWGQDQPKKQWSLYQPVMELFSRTLGRMPQVSDWQQIWNLIKADYQGRTPVPDFKNPYANLTRYEPIIQSLLPAPLFTQPQVSYAPGLSF